MVRQWGEIFVVKKCVRQCQHAGKKNDQCAELILTDGSFKQSEFWAQLGKCKVEEDGKYKLVRLPSGSFLDKPALGNVLLLTPNRQHMLKLADECLNHVNYAIEDNMTFVIRGTSDTGAHA